ncbi:MULTISPECIES: NAD(P)/FAD-dependent oxidoreductase [Trichocoleus]|uniref:NAD(P)/FAD-dependent oxidoreductase n=1 Tax=Trichocoleus desertorum GB2-A4 TaxID=2933944 RepID=A0ABV0JAC4_9CYAN|nr:NAD(P)/FAD-dependent oxidoreductase [Trichocoleus sp. FACHB-46]MBD1861433.1 NAD(P)/FAD-dependent oxidoreductase [Trichocoleus sp. FACHB-46]
MSSRPLKVLVIGGGAAGFFGAIACAEAHPHAQVMLLEAGRQLLPKVRISGGGRCNVTHACFDPAVLTQYYPRGGKALRGAFTRFQPRDMIAWLDQHGVELKTEADGRMFPTTDDSETIVDCFIHAAKAAGVEIRTGVPVAEITRLDSGFEVALKSGQTLSCDRLLLTTGSSPQGYQLAKQLGHKVAPPVPSLFTFNVSDPRLHDLAGVSASSVRVRLRTSNDEQFEQSGPLLITHWGLSGPAVLKLSAWGARALHDSRYQGTLQINWLPQYKPEALREQLLAVKSQLPRKAIAPNCPVLLPRRLWERLIASAGITETTRWAELSNKALNQLLQELTQGSYTVKGKGAFKEEFVTCGGVSLKEVDFKTMESRCCPRLYLAGEILDIDGVTGGFNFQSAWTTAWLAGQAIG